MNDNFLILIFLWVIISFVLFLSKFNFNIILGPNIKLIVLGIQLNTYIKYILFIFYICFNTIIRNINNEIVRPYIILNIQNKNNLNLINYSKGYRIIVISNIYGWFDWYLNVNLFFTQIDIVIFNIISDILSQIVICRYYLKKKNEGFQLIDNENL